MSSIIQLSEVYKVYDIGGEQVYALDGLSMQIDKGEFVAIVGPSGSGKSTFMNIVGCLDVMDRGSYLLDGQQIEQYTQKQLAQIRNKKIGFIFQGFNLLSKLTAYENVELPLIYQGLSSSVRHERVMQALGRVGLEQRLRHKPTELSGGQQQRVAVARALVTNPAILLADEPTGNLDSRTGTDILNLFSELNDAGNTIVLITHDDDIAKKAQRRVHIKDGNVWKEGA